ncbi:MAG: hypothetical protein ACTTKO_00315 [Candidatus Limimorpha sp.]
MKRIEKLRITPFSNNNLIGMDEGRQEKGCEQQLEEEFSHHEALSG